jgi:chromate transporter
VRSWELKGELDVEPEIEGVLGADPGIKGIFGGDLEIAGVLVGKYGRTAVGSGAFPLWQSPVSGQSDGGYPVSRRTGTVALVLLVLPLVLLPVWAAASGSPLAMLLEGVYRAGALVFGGGHVVLPLLQTAVVQSGTVSTADLLAGYGAAQAVPGPLFTFAAYLGAMAAGPLSGWAGGLTLLAVIFMPAVLVLVGVLPFWESLSHRKDLQASIAGVNAGVVGILLAALYDPVWTSAIHDRWDVTMALVAFGLLVVARAPPIVVVLLAAMAGWAMAR